MKRPDHNSPIKETIKELDTETTRTNEEKPKSKITLAGIDSEEDNSMMLRQLVTRLDDSRGVKRMQSDPYCQKKKEKYYVAEAIKNYMDRDSAVRDHLFNSLYFLELLVDYDNTSKYAEDKPINLPQHPKFQSTPSVSTRQNHCSFRSRLNFGPLL